jgi:quercetin dioxygenase-like cupin family protein
MNIPATRFRKLIAVTTCVTLVASLSAVILVRAQPAAEEDDPRFTGASTSLDTDGLGVSHRWFEAGARSAWHRHTGGQLLFVEEGRARTQKRGAAMHEMSAGDSDYTSPRVEHWHGAAPDTHFVQVATRIGDGSEWATEWLEKVTDEEYDGH